MSFEKQLKFALKHYKHPAKLAAESPLATPFFLGGSLPNVSDVSDWGEVLVHILTESADALYAADQPLTREQIEADWQAILQQPDSDRYMWLVLELRYLQRFFRPRSLNAVFSEFLGTSRSQFYRDVDTAVKRLGSGLLRRVQPLIRLAPPQAAAKRVGYEGYAQQLSDSLQAGQSVALEGVSGSGKTALAAAVVAAWGTRACWLTLATQINDDASSLLYTIAYFCRQQGQLELWKLLLLEEGRVSDWGLALGLMREDFAAIDANLLVCIDEVDLWQQTSESNLAQIGQMLTDLQSVATVLLIGQSVNWPTAKRLLLSGLDSAEINTLLANNGLTVSPAQLNQLQQQTRGNPRLLWLVVSLLKQGDTLDALFTESNRFRGYLWQLWTRLSPEERGLLQLLSVFPTVAPADAFSAELISALDDKHLLQNDGRGGIFLLQLVRALLYEQLLAEQREKLHVHAAAIQSERGAFTQAAWHLARGNRPKEAVQLWFPYRKQEIESGALATARSIFSQISLSQLRQREATALGIIRAELDQLSGDARQGLSTLDAVVWPDSAEISIKAQQLRGDFLDALGQSDRALASYEDGVTTTARLLAQMGDLRVRQGALQGRQRQMSDAWRSAQLARLEAEHLQGFIADEQGEFALAETHYRAALSLGEQLDSSGHIARAQRFLSRLFGKQGKLAQAVAHGEQAVQFYEAVGDRVGKAATQSNLTAIYLNAGDYAAVVALGEPILTFFREVEHAHAVAGTACNLAEASFHLGEFAAAEQYVHIAMAQEQPLAIPYALFTRALIEQQRGAIDSAESTLLHCIKIADQNDDSYIAAYAWELLAQVTSDQAAADKAAALFAALGIVR